MPEMVNARTDQTQRCAKKVKKIPRKLEFGLLKKIITINSDHENQNAFTCIPCPKHLPFGSTFYLDTDGFYGHALVYV